VILRAFWAWFRQTLWAALDLAAQMAASPKTFECPVPGCPYIVLGEEAGYRTWRLTVLHPYRGRPRLVSCHWPHCPQHDVPMRVR
jgi:hypothetical protein